MQHTTFNIDGMTCSGCTASVQKALQAQAGVLSISVSLEEGLATIGYDEAQVSEQQLLDAIEAAGFDAAVALA